MKSTYRIVFSLLLIISHSLAAQLRTGHSEKTINFREGPGMNYKISSTIDHSNLLVILPRAPKNGFVEVFDVETSSRGYVYESLISFGDTLNPQKQNFFEQSGENANGDVELVLVNRIGKPLFLWINGQSYNLLPHEKKVLIMQEEDITYFTSTPGVFPIYGKEVLKKGNTYNWNFSL